MEISEKSREMHQSFCKGWNTWDVYSVASHIHLPDAVRINFAFCVPHMSAYLKNVLWDNVKSFGEHSIDGTYTELEIEYLDGVYRIETSARDTEFIARIVPVKQRRNCHLIMEVSQIWDGRADIGYSREGITVHTGETQYRVEGLGAESCLEWNPSTNTNLTYELTKVQYFRVNSDKNGREIEEELKEAKKRWLDNTITASGILGDGLEAMRRSLLWNLTYEPRSKRVITPVSKNWSNPDMFNNFGTELKNEGILNEMGEKGMPHINIHGNYVLFDWDTFFASLMYGLFDKNLAYMTAFSALEEMCDEYYIPNASTGNGKVRDRTQPQLGSVCVWKLYQQYREKWFLEECFERLLRWNRWRMENRDFRKDGLLELGAAVPGGWKEEEEIWPYVTLGLKWALGCESGLDNSTMWDAAALNEDMQCMELYYVGLNAEMVMDCECLEKMARILGRLEEAEELRQRRIDIADKVRQKLWCEEKGCFLNCHWNGEFEETLSPTHFYTLTAGIASAQQADRMIKEHLMNPDEFWGEFVIPSTPKNDVRYQEQDYWRGRIWAPLNYMVGEGLIRYKKYDIFKELSRKGLEMFAKDWKERGIVGENYNAAIGKAAEKPESSDKFYHWGALFAYMYIQNIINFNPWTDRIELLADPDSGIRIRNISLADGKGDICGNQIVRK